MAMSFADEEAAFLASEQALMAYSEGGPVIAANGTALSRKEEFADAGNIESCCRYINQSLAAYGCPSPLPLQSYDADAAAQVCNCIYFLLQQRQRDMDFRESALEQRQRLTSDFSRCEAKVQRLQAALEARERELASAVSKEQKAVALLKGQLDKMKEEKEEQQRMATGLQQRQAQLHHEIRKKEVQYTRLQERLSALTSEKKEKIGTAGIEIRSLLQKEGRQRGTWDGKKADGEFYKMIVDSYETKKQDLTVENKELKDSLRHLQGEMQRLLRSQDGASSSTRVDTRATDTPLKGRMDVFDRPYQLSRERIEHSLRTKMASLQERFEQLQSAVAEDEATERELELDAQLADARAIIQEQEAIIQMSMEGGQTPQHGPRLSRDLASEVQLAAAEEDAAALRERIQHLESERQQYRRLALQAEAEHSQGTRDMPEHQDSG